MTSFNFLPQISSEDLLSRSSKAEDLPSLAGLSYVTLLTILKINPFWMYTVSFLYKYYVYLMRFLSISDQDYSRGHQNFWFFQPANSRAHTAYIHATAKTSIDRIMTSWSLCYFVMSYNIVKSGVEMSDSLYISLLAPSPRIARGAVKATK